MVGAKRRRGAIAVLAAAMLLVCADARAADGDFYIDGCLGRVAVPLCPATTVGLPVGIGQSPDGNQLYVGQQASGLGTFTGLQIYDRNPQSGLVAPRPGPTGCFVATNALAACTKVGGINNPGVSYDVKVAPDGRNVYMATWGGALLNFARDPASGALTYVNCVGAGEQLHGADLELRSPERRGQPGQQHRLPQDQQRAGGAGPQPDLAGHHAETWSSTAASARATCRPIATRSTVSGATGWKVAVSPDGAQVYVAFEEGDDRGGIGVFNRDVRRPADPTPGTGRRLHQPRRRSAVGRATAACPLTADSSRAYVTTVSPDGRSVYLGGYYGITSYQRNADGTLTQDRLLRPVSGLHAGAGRHRRRARPGDLAGRHGIDRGCVPQPHGHLLPTQPRDWGVVAAPRGSRLSVQQRGLRTLPATRAVQRQPLHAAGDGPERRPVLRHQRLWDAGDDHA